MGSRHLDRFQDLSCNQKPNDVRRVKSRRNAVQDLVGRRMNTDVVITKTGHDPKYKTYQKDLDRLASSVSDDMSPDVPYSMNKQKRWEITPFTLLQNAEDYDGQVFVLERNTDHRACWNYSCHIHENVRSVHFSDSNNGLKVKKTSKRKGTTLKNLMVDHQTHEKSKDCDCCRSWNEDPRIEYRILRHHENQSMCTGPITGKAFKGWTRTYVRCHAKRSCKEQFEDLIDDSETVEESLSEDGSTIQRAKTLCLGDFMVDKPLNMKEWVIAQ